MKYTSFTEPTIEFYFNFLGLKRSKEVAVEQAFIEPETVQEELDLHFLYHQARKNHLVTLQLMDAAISTLDHRIDQINKHQFEKVEDLSQEIYQGTKWYRRFFLDPRASVIKEVLIQKDLLNHVSREVDDLLTLFGSKEPNIPMKEMDYTMLLNVDHFVNYVTKTFDRAKAEIYERAKHLNVTL